MTTWQLQPLLNLLKVPKVATVTDLTASISVKKMNEEKSYISIFFLAAEAVLVIAFIVSLSYFCF
jgi:hypothetical protein